MQGTFSVMGKSRRAAKLPLPQDVGDAILHYLHTARPRSTATTFLSPLSHRGTRSPRMSSRLLPRRPSNVLVSKRRRMARTSCATRQRPVCCARGPRSRSSARCCVTVRSRPPPITPKWTWHCCNTSSCRGQESYHVKRSRRYLSGSPPCHGL
jgi:hypothetical protein